MLIQVSIETLFSLVIAMMSLLPDFPTLNLFQNLDTSEFSQTFISVTNILGYFLPCGTIVTLIGIELAINNYRTISACWYRVKHTIPFV